MDGELRRRKMDYLVKLYGYYTVIIHNAPSRRLSVINDREKATKHSFESANLLIRSMNKDMASKMEIELA
jgi:hypothetical protein